MTDIARIFAPPVYVHRVTGVEFFKIQNEIASSLPLVKFDQARENWGKTTDVTDIGEDVIADYDYFHFKHMLAEHIENFCNVVGFEPRPIFERKSWLTRNKPGGYTHVHNHTVSDLTGCYYHKTNGKDGDIFFTNPCLAATSSYFLQAMPSNITMPPEEGLLLLFPGYIMHGVQTNQTDEDRISLAFSILFERWKSE